MKGRLSTGLIIAGLVGVLGAACGDDDDPSPGNNAGTGNAGQGATGAGSGASGRSGSGGSGGTAGRAGMDGGIGFPGQVCPTAEPANGDTCQPARGDCMFGAKVCDCINDTSTWVCWDPATDCPTMRPAEQAACPVVGIECELPEAAQVPGRNDDCECTAMGWDCGGQFCPPAEPASASACENGDGMCTYGSRVCDCNNDSDTWACWDPADCPATQPAEQAACDTVGMSCDYEAAGGNECDCTAEGWDCGSQFCPATQPAAAAACEGGDGVCPYGDTSVCDCDSQAWVCWNPATDCPATMPAEMAACTLEGVICPYVGAECECEGTDGWECEVVEETDAGL